MKSYFVPLLVATFLLIGCQTVATPPNLALKDAVEISEGFTPGTTTKEDVRGLLGAPQTEMPSQADHSTYIYSFGNASSSDEVMMVFLFDPQGKFVRRSMYGRTP